MTTVSLEEQRSASGSTINLRQLFPQNTRFRADDELHLVNTAFHHRQGVSGEERYGASSNTFSVMMTKLFMPWATMPGNRLPRHSRATQNARASEASTGMNGQPCG